MPSDGPAIFSLWGPKNDTMLWLTINAVDQRSFIMFINQVNIPSCSPHTWFLP